MDYFLIPEAEESFILFLQSFNNRGRLTQQIRVEYQLDREGNLANARTTEILQ